MCFVNMCDKKVGEPMYTLALYLFCQGVLMFQSSLRDILAIKSKFCRYSDLQMS